MSEFKGTPGPWALLVDGFIHAKGGGLVADPLPWSPLHEQRSAEEIAANARLISAAPELLKALVGLERICTNHATSRGSMHSWWDDIRDARAAIAKALGGAA